jgi:hypothetical protein
MKITRRRKPLRPRPSRSQIRQQIDRLRRQVQLFRAEWILEAARKDRNPLHLRLLHERIASCQDEIDALETC